MAISYQLGGHGAKALLFKLSFGACVSSEIRAPAFSGDRCALLTTAQGKVRPG